MDGSVYALEVPALELGREDILEQFKTRLGPKLVAS